MAFENRYEFEQLILSRTLTSVRLFNINENYIVLNANFLAVIDGGIELNFEGNKLIISWNSKKELFDISNDSIEGVLGNTRLHKRNRQFNVRDLFLGCLMVQVIPF